MDGIQTPTVERCPGEQLRTPTPKARSWDAMAGTSTACVVVRGRPRVLVCVSLRALLLSAHLGGPIPDFISLKSRTHNP